MSAIRADTNGADLRELIGGASTVSKEEAATETHGLRAMRFKASSAEHPIDHTPAQRTK